MNKVKDFDILHFCEDILKVKQFESYYFESYQILNPSAIEKLDPCYMDIDYIMSPEFKKDADKVMKKVLKHLKTTDVYKRLSKKRK